MKHVKRIWMIAQQITATEYSSDSDDEAEDDVFDQASSMCSPVTSISNRARV